MWKACTKVENKTTLKNYSPRNQTYIKLVLIYYFHLVGSSGFKYGQSGERKQTIENFYFPWKSLHYVRIMSCACISSIYSLFL